MSTRANSLQAALAGASVEEPPVKAKRSKPAQKKQPAAGQGRAAKSQKAKPAAAPEAAKPKAKSRESTVLVGGHFPNSVSRQLRMIAAEEGTTNQALLAEALDLLFTRKGKDKIAELSAG